MNVNEENIKTEKDSDSDEEIEEPDLETLSAAIRIEVNYIVLFTLMTLKC